MNNKYETKVSDLIEYRGDCSLEEQKVLDELKHLPPLEAEKLRQDLKKEMITIDDKIRSSEERIEKAEEKEGSGPDILQ